jgi:P4 family phage/plasmid primase-like protien
MDQPDKIEVADVEAGEGIFAETAPAYFAKGLPVIPLQERDKRPLPKNWSQWHDRQVEPQQQREWLLGLPNSNIGIVLGEQSGLCVIDIDTDDPAIIRIIKSLVPTSPWERVGKKGMVLAFKYNGIATFRIKDVEGNTLVEMLSTRTQVVLPPSIHPSTQAPYIATCNLLDVIDELPVLNTEIEALLRGAFKEEGIELSYSGWTRVTDYVPAGARDVQMTSISGLFSAGVVRGELTLREAIDRLTAWKVSCVEKIAGDDVDIEKGIGNMVKFISRDVHEKGRILPKGWDEGFSEAEIEGMGLDFTLEHVEWDYEEMKDHLHENFGRHESGTPARMECIEYILRKVAFAQDMSSIDEDRILKYINDTGGMDTTLASLRKRIKELGQGELKGNDHAELAQAVIKDVEATGPLVFEANRFWTWNGSHWIEKLSGEILRVIAREYGHLPAAKRNSDHNGILRTMSSLVPSVKKTMYIPGVNFANGYLRKDGKLVKHDPGFGMTYTLPFRYVPDASTKAFKFQNFLHDCWGHCDDFSDRVDLLQEAMCATIFGMGPMFQTAILLYGAPKSGKSQLLKIVQALVPEEARTTCPPDQWADKFAPTTMYNKILNVCGELSDKKPIDGMKFKQIVDGEEMPGQLKGQQIFSFRPTCTNWFASNHLPRTDDTSSAFNRRWRILSFDTPVSKGKRKLDLGDEIAAEEREAIAAWAVEALDRLLERREYTEPMSHIETIAEVASMNNSVRFFIIDSGKVKMATAGKKILHPISEITLHGAYWSFCVGAGGAKPVGPRPFRQRMKELAVEMGFKASMINSENGPRECVYTGLILAD